MDKAIEKIKTNFSDKILNLYKKSAKRYYISIDKNDLLDFVNFVFNNLKARYMIETGVDTPEGIEILYHFALDKKEIVISLKTLLDHEKPEVESIYSVVPGAKWIEREIMDILGVKFLNHPNPQRFILSDDWNKNEYPLRRDYEKNKNKK